MYMRYYLDEKGNRVYTLKVFYFMSYLFSLLMTKMNLLTMLIQLNSLPMTNIPMRE